MNWTIMPLMRPFLCWVAGMVIAFCTEWPQWTGWFLFLLLLLGYIKWGLLNTVRKNSLLTGWLLLGLFGTMGFCIYEWRYAESQRLVPFIQSGRLCQLHLVITKEIPSGYYKSFRCEVASVTGDGTILYPPCPDVVIRFAPSDDVAAHYEPFDRIDVTAVISSLRMQTNPGAFDMASYQLYQGISAQVTPGEGCHTRKDSGQVYPLQQAAMRTNRWIKNIILQYIREKRARAVTTALLTGDDALIDHHLYNAYAISGAVHVLSVSGMHVAIFIAPFLWLFARWYTSVRWLEILKLLFLLALIVFYAMMTGLSASVVRSAVMMAVMLIAGTFFRRQDSLHVVTLTGMAMLWYDPFYLHQVSFQFSFLSLVSILLFEPRITTLFCSRFWLVQHLWKILSVSAAAQVLMVPWSVWYFHQVSLIGLVSGIVAVPLVTVIMYIGSVTILLEALSLFTLSSLFTCLTWLVECMNDSILLFSRLPVAGLRDLYLNLPALATCIAGQFFMISWLFTRSRFSGVLAAALMLVSWCSIQWHTVDTHRRAGIVVYDIRDLSVIDLYTGHQRLTWTDVPDTFRSVQFAVRSFRIEQGIVSNYEVRREGSRIRLDSILVYITGKQDSCNNGLNYRYRSDILIDTGWNATSPDQWLQSVRPSLVILAGGVPWKRRKLWQKLALSNTFRLHIVQLQGAWKFSQTDSAAIYCQHQ